jgi:hypothetical protein
LNWKVNYEEFEAAVSGFEFRIKDALKRLRKQQDAIERDAARKIKMTGISFADIVVLSAACFISHQFLPLAMESAAFLVSIGLTSIRDLIPASMLLQPFFRAFFETVGKDLAGVLRGILKDVFIKRDTAKEYVLTFELEREVGPVRIKVK